jgi:diaminopimelate epimerase
MEINFQKYQGTGNDFVMIDCVNQSELVISIPLIQQLCNRRFGIGADGLICIYKHDDFDFEMKYYNSDGSRSFCGNGARCAVAFAHSLGLFKKDAHFLAIDGEHHATLNEKQVHLLMADVKSIIKDNDAYVLDTGSPHFVSFVNDLDAVDILKYGKEVRYSLAYKEQGINVNLVEKVDTQKLNMLTYERGVEDETFSCGTGATAVALAFAIKSNVSDPFEFDIKVKGGRLKVSATPYKEGFKNIYLIGPATYVFNGSVSV